MYIGHLTKIKNKNKRLLYGQQFNEVNLEILHVPKKKKKNSVIYKSFKNIGILVIKI